MKKTLMLLGAVCLLALAPSCKNNISQSAKDSAAVAVDNDSTDIYEYSEDVTVNNPASPAPTAVGKPYVVDFFATWCGPCKKLAPYFSQMEEAYAGQATFTKVDIDKQPELAKKHNIQGVPTVIVFSDSTMTNELYRMEGFAPQELEEALTEFI